MTADVDVTLEWATPRLPELLRAAIRHGLSLRDEGAVRDVPLTHVVPLRVGRPPIAVDVILAGPGLEERFLERVRFVRLGRTMVPVISPEDLIVTKLIAARPRDLEDVRSVLRERSDALDRDYVENLLAEVEDALGRSDLRVTLRSLDEGGR